MKRSQYIMGLFVMLLVAACARVPQQASKEAFQEAQCQYDSGFQLFENKALMEAFPYFIQVAGKLEVLPEDMDSAAMRLTSQAYVQMAHVFKLYIEDNAEIDALKRALYYQRMVNDTSQRWTTVTKFPAEAFEGVDEAHDCGPKLAIAYPNPGKEITENVTAINTTSWPAGSYVWKVMANGKEAERGKWIKN